MRDVFSNKPIEKSYDTISDCLGMISKIKTTRDKSELGIP